MDPGLGPHHDLVADLGVVLDPGLAGHHDVVAGLAAPGDPHLPAEQVVAADLVVVADHDQIVDLGPFADPGGLEGRAVDRAVRADFHVVADLDLAGVRDLDVLAVDRVIFEAVATEDRPGVDLDAVAQDHVGIEDGVGGGSRSPGRACSGRR